MEPVGEGAAHSSLLRGREQTVSQLLVSLMRSLCLNPPLVRPRSLLSWMVTENCKVSSGSQSAYCEVLSNWRSYWEVIVDADLLLASGRRHYLSFCRRMTCIGLAQATLRLVERGQHSASSLMLAGRIAWSVPHILSLCSLPKASRTLVLISVTSMILLAM